MSTDSTDILEPVAGLSAASACIRLSLQSSKLTEQQPMIDTSLTLSFRPVYTHQCFEKECINGWWPSLEAEQQSRRIYQLWKQKDGIDEKIISDNDILHKSYQHLNDQREAPNAARLDVHILLSPICDSCRIEMSCFMSEKGEPSPKKAKKMVTFVGERSDSDPTNPKMDMKDIVRKISLACPPIVSVQVNSINRNDLLLLNNTQIDDGTVNEKKHYSTHGSNMLTTVIGKQFKTYHRRGKEFVITLADGSDLNVAKYHNSIQPLARWFIETADEVDIADTSRGIWKVVYLFQYQEDDNNVSPSPPDSIRKKGLAGYITLLHVHSPFRKPRPGIILRICQALIFPPYHRSGHGSEMLKSIYDYANRNFETETSTGMEIVEINVEDPAPAFTALRDAVDYYRFVSFCNETTVNMNYLKEYVVTDKQYFVPISNVKVELISEQLKMTKRQIQIVHEIYKLYQIGDWKKSQNNEETIRQVETSYRLMVKKSLKALREEELGACPDGKEGQKILLAKWFDETLLRYHKVLRSKV